MSIIKFNHSDQEDTAHPQLPVRPIQKQSIPEAIIQELKSLIDSGYITQGNKLPSERELAKMLDVSRPSLRIAIKALSLLGILENRQGDGTYLTNSDQWPIEPLSIILSLHKGALMDIFEARECVENTCAGYAAIRRDEGDLNEMKRILDLMRATFNDPDKYIKHCLNFHKAVILSAKNPVLIDLTEKIYKLLEETPDNDQKYPSELYRETSFQQHVAIFENIKIGNSEKAREAMDGHMRHMKERLMERKVKE